MITNDSKTSGMMKEPGMIDNRLSLDPNQFDFTKDWQDGEEYEMTVKVKQISPGEFEVTDASSEGEGAAETADANEEAEPEPQPPGRYKNPAVAALAESDQ